METNQKLADNSLWARLKEQHPEAAQTLDTLRAAHGDFWAADDLARAVMEFKEEIDALRDSQ